MSKKKTKKATAATGNSGEERPLFSYSYEVSGQLVSDMATALAGDTKRNPPMIATYALLVLVLLVALSPLGTNTALLITLVIIELAVWYVSTKWHSIQERRLRKLGFDPAFIPEDKRRRSVSVYDDRVVVELPDDETKTYPISSMGKPCYGDGMLVMSFSGKAFVPVPHKALSATRHNQLVRFIAEKTGAKID